MIEQCYKRNKTTVNPIVEWKDSEVWDFIRSHGICYCCLYDEGFSRLGCIGCPNAGKHREQQFLRWPKYRDSYLRAFSAMLKEIAARGHDSWKYASVMDIYRWWMEYDVLPGQFELWDEDLEL